MRKCPKEIGTHQSAQSEYRQELIAGANGQRFGRKLGG
jgi:hypothetical protein